MFDYLKTIEYSIYILNTEQYEDRVYIVVRKIRKFKSFQIKII